MDRDKIVEICKELVKNHFGVESEDINDDSHFIDDLHGYPLDIVELCMGCEDEFQISIPDTVGWESVNTFRDLVNLVESLLK
jgi:acyl carrier protein